MTKPRRTDFIAFALDMWRAPYVWGGDAPSGTDCSGVVAYAYWRAGGQDWRGTHNSQRLWDSLVSTPTPKIGDLCLYGSSSTHISHVMLWFGGPVYGASGGNRDCDTVEKARQLGAQVKLKKSHLYRPDFLGFRSMPLED